MPPTEMSVEQLFNRFVLESEGQLVSSIVTTSNLPPNADYYFQESAVIGELKCLQQDSFDEVYKTKMQKLADDWMKRRLLVVFGTAQISLKHLHPICQMEWMDLIGIPLQNTLIKYANRQIRETKKLLNVPEARGILFISSDGNSSLQPYELMYFLDRVLKKKKEDGIRQYSNIDGFVYFSWSMPGRVPNIPMPIQFWIGGARDPNDTKTQEFIDKLERRWYEFQCKATGQNVPRLVQKSNFLKEIKIS
jgi:hypothetical protein